MLDGSILGLAQLLRWMLVAEHELLLFAAFFFIVSAVDEAAVDFAWLWLRLNGHSGTGVVPSGLTDAPLLGHAAILVPAWHEDEVIGSMIAHTLSAWRQREFTLYIGCYRNDPKTLAAAVAGAGGDCRVRIVVNGFDGPTTKADCLNRLYAALRADETRSGKPFRNIILHDAEDMVHPAALAVIDRALADVEFVQLPVRPEPQPRSLWIAGHYSDEFTESHAKTLVVRDAEGRLVATRSYFPSSLDAAVRQKARWIHGIALQGWERLGWNGRPVEIWMTLRDRRGPLTAVVLAAAYLLLLIEGLLGLARLAGWHEAPEPSALLRFMIALSFVSLLWRMVFRFAFTTREYGVMEGVLSLFRIPIANIIAIMAGRRALLSYMGTLRGGAVRWDKTVHGFHPATREVREAAA